MKIYWSTFTLNTTYSEEKKIPVLHYFHLVLTPAVTHLNGEVHCLVLHLFCWWRSLKNGITYRIQEHNTIFQVFAKVIQSATDLIKFS